MGCVIKNVRLCQQTMKCAVGAEDENVPDIEMVPQGCLPVSEDVCKSGFKAVSENITFPDDALDTCCRCKEGETCKYCADPTNCTDREKKIYVTTEDCFGKAPGPGPAPDSEEKVEETTSTPISVVLIPSCLCILMISLYVL